MIVSPPPRLMEDSRIESHSSNCRVIGDQCNPGRGHLKDPKKSTERVEIEVNEFEPVIIHIFRSL